MPSPRLLRLALVLFLLAAGLDVPVYGQEETAATELNTRIGSFFRHLSETSVPERAFKELLADGPLEKHEDVLKLIEEVQQFDAKYGPYVESERIDVKVVGNDLVLLKYLYKAEKYPVIWYFTYYRPPNSSGDTRDWVVISLRFDTRLESLGL